MGIHLHKSTLLFFFLFAISSFVPTQLFAAETPLYGVVESIAGGTAKHLTKCPLTRSGALMEEFAPFCQEQVEYCIENPELSYWVGGCGNARITISDSLHQGIAFMYTNRPAGVDIYLADLMHNINPAIQPAYAQGIGYASLSPILPIWKAFRNLAYMLYVFIFIIIGFAIMFRTKINAQVVVSIESALPSLIITLILISFSYAIAGGLIDLMYVSIYFTINFLKLSGIFISDTIGTNLTLQDVALNKNIIDNTFTMFGTGVVNNMASAVGEMVSATLSNGDQIIGWLSSVVAWLIFAIVIVFNAFKIFFTLLSAYIQIIFFIIFSPLILLGNAMPGSNAFVSWLRNIASNLALFPALVLMLLLVYALLGGDGVGPDIGYLNDSSVEGFVPPQLLAGNADAVKGLIGVGIILAIPSLLTQVKGFVSGSGGGGGKGGGGFLGGLGIGAALAPGIAPFKAIGRPVGKFAGAVATDVGSSALGRVGRIIPGSQRVGDFKDYLERRQVRKRIVESQRKTAVRARVVREINDSKPRTNVSTSPDSGPGEDPGSKNISAATEREDYDET